MRKTFVPLTVIPGARRRVNPDTLMAMSNSKGNPLWDMPTPIRSVEHKRPSKKGIDMVRVPIYRGTSAAYARWVKAQIKRSQRKAAEAQAVVDALNAAQAAIKDLALNPGGQTNENR